MKQKGNLFSESKEKAQILIEQFYSVSALLHILVEKKKKELKQKESPEVKDCIVEQCLDVPLKFGID